MPRYDPVTGGARGRILYSPQKQILLSIIQFASGGRLRQQDGATPIVRRWDRRTPPRKARDRRVVRARTGACTSLRQLQFGRKSRLKELMACPCLCPGSAVAPLPRLTIDGTKICESGNHLTDSNDAHCKKPMEGMVTVCTYAI